MNVKLRLYEYCYSNLGAIYTKGLLNNRFSRSNTKFTPIHKCMPLPTHQDGVENRDKAYCRFASQICDYIYKVNYYLGMKIGRAHV